MATGSAVLLHPALRRAPRPRLARRAGSLAAELVLALALIAGGTVTAVVLLLLVVLAAPLGGERARAPRQAGTRRPVKGGVEQDGGSGRHEPSGTQPVRAKSA